MSNEEIINKALKKAENNGYKFEPWKLMNPEDALRGVIFNHQFAKAFFGEEEIETELVTKIYTVPLSGEIDDVDHLVLPAWKYHLARMVLEDDPIKYFEQFL